MKKLFLLITALAILSNPCYALQASSWQLVKSLDSVDVFFDKNNTYEKSDTIYIWTKNYYKSNYENQKNLQLLQKAGVDLKSSLSYSVELGKFFTENNIVYYAPIHIEYYDVDGNSVYSIENSSGSTTTSTTSTTTTATNTSSLNITQIMVVPDSLFSQELQAAQKILTLQKQLIAAASATQTTTSK